MDYCYNHVPFFVEINNIVPSYCTICPYCCQRLLLYLNNLFSFGEHFQTRRFLIKHNIIPKD